MHIKLEEKAEMDRITSWDQRYNLTLGGNVYVNGCGFGVYGMVLALCILSGIDMYILK